ncbi:alanine racemase [Actinospica durhamensis]|uniref:Alanine racemase n=1 Tax=Actinospica durhamensis TaxID=1508375 RepID=A0A941IM26_9ACTN|nr:alanine racemase [Actinospica durhamensis]MBR7832394.1 alanine racemase [Actinospica durhamensis]
MSTRTAAPPARLEARVDLDALRSNVRRLREIAGPAQVMAVVKADAYGHGMVPCARAAVQAGAAWLGTALPEEALALRAAGLEVPILTWLHAPGDDFAALVRAGVDVSISGQWSLDAVLAAVGGTRRPARIQLKADTGLGRNGIQPREWPAVVDEAVKAERAGLVEVTGLWSHFACADEPGHPSIRRQLTSFHEALEYAEAAGLRGRLRHMANSPATLTLPESHFDLVRPGVAVYGLSPAPELGVPADFGLRPVMTLRGRLALVKQVPEAHGVSYGHTYHTTGETRLGLVPAGYADGIPRAASDRGPVWIGGRRYVIAGRVAMDQFVVDLGPAGPGEQSPAAGDEVVLFGPGEDGGPTAQDWAQAIGTIGYEVVTRIGGRVPRVYVD